MKLLFSVRLVYTPLSLPSQPLAQLPLTCNMVKQKCSHLTVLQLQSGQELGNVQFSQQEVFFRNKGRVQGQAGVNFRLLQKQYRGGLQVTVRLFLQLSCQNEATSFLLLSSSSLSEQCTKEQQLSQTLDTMTQAISSEYVQQEVNRKPSLVYQVAGFT